MRQKDFTKEREEAERDYRRNKNAVTGPLRQREKRITGQVRMLVSNIRQLKLLAAHEGQIMSRLLDEIVGAHLQAKGFPQNYLLMQRASPADKKGRKAKLPLSKTDFPQNRSEIDRVIPP
jgi:hypothetical protein